MVNKDFFQALDELEAEKKINKEQFIEALEAALTGAYKKMYGQAKSAMVKLNPEKNTIKIYSYKTVVDVVKERDKEISVEDARLIKKSYKAGDVVITEESPREFGRIAAQTAKQIIVQRLKDIESQIAREELSEKEDELLTTVIKRIDNGTVFVSISGSHTEGVMLEKDQIKGEKYNIGDRIKVYVKRIQEGFNGPSIHVSRSNIGFIRKLLQLEIPEIQNGEVKVKSIARDAGSRCKIAVYSEKPNLEPVGACVGNRGARINAISNELNGEKIDLIHYTDDVLEFIARALSPAKVISVETNESLKASRVVVPDDQLSIAIGKSGQNVRLASRLTGWRIEIKSESQVMKTTNNLDLKELEEFELTELKEDNVSDFANLEDLSE